MEVNDKFKLTLTKLTLKSQIWVPEYWFKCKRER